MSDHPPSSDSPPDKLVGDQAFRAIYEENVTWVWNALRRFSVAEKDVMDATQNVFVVVHKKLPEFEGRSQLRTWILQIARRVASDYRRSAPVRREVATELTDFENRASVGQNGEEAASQQQRVGLARQILDGLPKMQREVFIMYELEQMSGQEIADELGISLGTVRSRLRLARGAFHQGVFQLCGGSREVG